MNVWVVTSTELGCDCVMGVYESSTLEAAKELFLADYDAEDIGEEVIFSYVRVVSKKDFKAG